ncbi:MAG: ROK family protein [Chloroflexi bacterium]|nr:ROK family protein [Chloroflexota bacterium]
MVAQNCPRPRPVPPFTPHWLARRRVFTPDSADGLHEYTTMLAMARELVAEVGSPDVIGVSFGGPVDVSQGLVRLSHRPSPDGCRCWWMSIRSGAGRLGNGWRGTQGNS